MRASLASFTKLFVDKYKLENIRMNNILPGFIDPCEKEENRKLIPMGRLELKNEIASVVSFLCSDGGKRQVTGQNIKVDGGSVDCLINEILVTIKNPKLNQHKIGYL